MHASLYRIVNICSIFFMIENFSCFSDFYGVYMFCMLGLKAGVGEVGGWVCITDVRQSDCAADVIQL